MGVLENRSHGDGELFAASGALPDAFADMLILAAFFGGFWLQLVGVIDLATVRTDRAIGPSQLFDEFPRLIFIAKVLSQRD